MTEGIIGISITAFMRARNVLSAPASPASKPATEQGSSNVSLIVPTYYRGGELSRLLNSLLRQSVRPMEIIVVDDTPTDAIKLVCEDYEPKFLEASVALVYVKNAQERSLTIARNLGVKMARGDVLTFVDSDMILHHDYIREVLKTFREYPESLGVAGWIRYRGRHKDLSYYILETQKRLFLLFHDSKDSCRFPEYPTVLTKTISCQWFSGSNMTWKRNIFNEHEFDENLKGYAFMEDVLFSSSIFREYPGKLLLTPHAKCIHTFDMEGRPKGANLKDMKLRNRKYVLTKLFGAKGLLMFGWENFGLLILRVIMRILGKEAQDTFL